MKKWTWYIYIHIHVCKYIYIYIYVKREMFLQEKYDALQTCIELVQHIYVHQWWQNTHIYMYLWQYKLIYMFLLTIDTYLHVPFDNMHLSTCSFELTPRPKALGLSYFVRDTKQKESISSEKESISTQTGNMIRLQSISLFGETYSPVGK